MSDNWGLPYPEALVRCLNALGDVAKGREAKIATKAGPDFRYQFANIDDLLDVVKPTLAEWGFAFLQPLGSTPDGKSFTVTCVLLHHTGAEYRSEPLVRPANSDARAFGSEVTYARRYSAQSFLGLATDDDDGAEASAGAARARREPAEKPPERPQTAAARPAPRSHAEAHIVDEVGKLNPNQQREVMGAFRKHFGSGLSTLAVGRHDEASIWVQEKIRDLTTPAPGVVEALTEAFPGSETADSPYG